MDKGDLRELYKLETKLQLIDADLKELSKKIPELKETVKQLESLNDRFEKDRKDIWTFINTLTKDLREGEKLK